MSIRLQQCNDVAPIHPYLAQIASKKPWVATGIEDLVANVGEMV